MVLILAVGITTVFFMGNISDTKTVDLINCTKENGIPLEMIKLE
jgi:hypothetical protein